MDSAPWIWARNSVQKGLTWYSPSESFIAMPTSTRREMCLLVSVRLGPGDWGSDESSECAKLVGFGKFDQLNETDKIKESLPGLHWRARDSSFFVRTIDARRISDE